MVQPDALRHYDDDASSAFQRLGGGVGTPQGGLLAFSNFLWHHTEAFRLTGASRPDHRKIFVILLVNPMQWVLSMANVPPQRRE